MTDKEILENNKLIANFYDTYLTVKYITTTVQQHISNYKDLRFHESWDWLMPVIIKIEKLGFSVDTKYCHCIIINGLNCDKYININTLKESKIKAVYEAIIKFIKWYNEKNK